jgi:hypothetical protein
MFVRVNLPISQPYKALLVIDQAIASIQGRKNLYVLDDKDTVQELPVTIGQVRDSCHQLPGSSAHDRMARIKRMVGHDRGAGGYASK